MGESTKTPAVPVSQGAAGAAGTNLSEAQWQKRVTDAATLHGWRWCHTRKATVRQGRIATPTSHPGWPDLVLWHAGRKVILFVELKADKGVLSDAQADVLDSLAKAGGHVAIWRPRDWDEVLLALAGGEE